MVAIKDKTISGKRVAAACLATLLLVVAAGRVCRAEDREAHKLLTRTVRQFEQVTSYTCRLDKRVVKEGTLYEDLDIFVKFKKPAHYYFRWNSGARKGQEVIFAPGRYDDKIVAHPGGLFRFVTVRLDPHGRRAMKENRHALSHSGLEKIIDLVDADYRRALENGLDAIGCIGPDRVDGRRVSVVQGEFPENQGYYAKRVVLYIDEALWLPIKVHIYDWSDTCVEAYVFHDLRINVDLTVSDFDIHHPDYQYSGE